MKGKIFTKLAILTILGLFLVVPSCFAATVLETTEEYTENGAFIYGSTRFDPTTIMTPDVVFNAGINESKVWVALGNKLNDLKPVTPYYYDGASWFKVASTKVTPITDETTIEKIEDNLHIFFVGEEMKTIEVPYDGTVDEGSETEGAVYDKENKQFLVPALSFGFEFKIGGVEVEVETNVDTNIKEGNTEEVKEESFVAEGHKTVKEGDTYKVLPYDANNVTDEKELKALIAKGGTVKLGGNIELAEKSIGITGEAVVLDLNGYTLSVSEKYTSNNVIWTSAELTVKDSSNGKGTIDTIINEESYIVALYAYNGGKITIENGTYIGIPDAEEASDTIYVRGEGSQVIINGGNFVGDETFTLNKYDSDREVTSIIVKGGTFTGFNPANNKAEGPDTNFVAEGYTVKESKNEKNETIYAVVAE